MLYDALRFYPGGDRAIEVELADVMDFGVNFTVHRLVAAVKEARISAVEDIIPELASFQVTYDPDEMPYAALTAEIAAIYERIGRSVTGTLRSRLITIPVLYFDELTSACVDAYRRENPEKMQDVDLVCELNGMSSREELARVHSGTEYWVAALGFWPGLCSLLPLKPGHRITAPKYNPPRTDTPKGAIGIGGALTCIYPDDTPGGYQLIGHTPTPTYDGRQRLPDFRNSLALFRAGDRVRFRPIDAGEYVHLQQEVASGAYRHDIIDYQIFSVDEYLKWAEAMEAL